MVRERSVHLAAWLGRLPPARIRYQDRILVRIGGVVRASVSAGYAVTAVKLDGVTEYTGVSNDRDIILVGIGGTTPTKVLWSVPDRAGTVSVRSCSIEDLDFPGGTLRMKTRSLA